MKNYIFSNIIKKFLVNEGRRKFLIIYIKINMFFYLGIFIIVSIIFTSNCKGIIKFKDSIITLKVSSEGEANVFYDGKCNNKYSPTKPSNIFIDDVEKKPVQSAQNLKPENIVKLIWENDITECRCMFRFCSSIAEINFIQFDTSKCKDMVGMFRGCSSLKSLDLSGFDTTSVTQMSDMFWDCLALTSLDLSSFDTSKVTHGMGHMFANCKSLTSLNISHFNTSIVIYTDNMFNGCESLKILDFSNFDSKNAKKISDMFINCKNLEYINLKNYKLSNYLDNNFFKGTPDNFVVCTESIELINISNNLECNIVDCSDNWHKNRKKINMENNSCTDDCTLTNYKYEYNYNCYQKCLTGTYNNNYKCIACHPDCKECEGPYTLNNTNCSSCSSPDKVLKYGNCVDNNECLRGTYYNENTQQNSCKCDLIQCFTCNIESYYKHLCTECENNYYPIYDYDNIYFPYLNCSKSPIGYYLDGLSSKYKLCYLSCKSCDKSGDEIEHNCKECKYSFNYEINFGLYKNCYINCSYYHYFDSDVSYCTIKEECPKEFDKLIEDKNECVFNCTNDEYYKYEFRKHCYQECPLNSTLRKNITELEGFSLDKIYFCKPICYEEAPFEILYTQECVKNCAIKYIIDKSCILNFKILKVESDEQPEKKEEKEEKVNKKEDDIKAYDIMSENIETGFTSDEYDTSGLDQGKNDIVQFEKMTFTLTTTENQINDKNNSNITTVDLGDCEQLLRIAYNISEKEKIYMKKIDVIQEGMKTPKVEYDVYSKINGSNLIKLNLSHCPNSKVDISVPAEITENIDKLNSSSGYYNDICYTTTSDSGTDIILKDRKIEFVEGNKTICQEKCIFSDYDKKIKKAKCTCDIVQSSSSFADIHINKEKLYENFVNFRNIANVNLLICYRVLFSKKGVIKNYGALSLIPLLLFHFIIIILFYAKNLYKKIEENIKDISYGIKNWHLVIKEEREMNEKELKKLRKKMEIKNKKIKKKKIIHKNYKIIPPIYLKYREKLTLSNIPYPIFYQYCDKIDEKEEKLNYNPPIKKCKKDNGINLINNNLTRNFMNNKYQNQSTIGNIPKSNCQIKSKFSNNSINALERTKEIMSYNDEELNNLEYELALRYDKRTYCNYYLSLLKTNHIIMFTFFNNSDYNSKIVKIDLFLFNFSLDYAINTLFFNDNTMHQIYEDKGSFNITYQFPQIAYSSLISAVFRIILELLALSEGLILDFKKRKEKKDLKEREKALNHKLKIKFILYFILSTLLLLFFWYYISMFCAIYINTQLHLIKDTLLSFSLSLIYPCFIYLIPGLFRIPSLSNTKSKKIYLYKFSKFIQMI